MTDFPTPAEELDRKTVETLQTVMHSLTVARTVTLAEARGTLKALWGVAAGLVPKETMELIASSSKMVEDAFQKKGAPEQLAVLQKGEQTAIAARYGVGISVTVYLAGVKTPAKSYVAPKDEVMPDKWAFDKFNAAVDAMVKGGYERIV